MYSSRLHEYSEYMPSYSSGSITEEELAGYFVEQDTHARTRRERHVRSGCGKNKPQRRNVCPYAILIIIAHANLTGNCRRTILTSEAKSDDSWECEVQIPASRRSALSE